MKLPKTEDYIKKGIRMSRITHRGYVGVFSSQPDTYEYKQVYDLDEAINMNTDGWSFVYDANVFQNLALMLYRDLRDLKDSTEKK